MLDKTTAVTVLSGEVTKQVLPPGQRAGQVQHFHRHAPGGRRQMQPDYPAPLEREQAAKQHEQDKGEVKQHQAVGSETEEHCGYFEGRGLQSKGLLAGKRGRYCAESF